jgi:hypothetical protein
VELNDEIVNPSARHADTDPITPESVTAHPDYKHHFTPDSYFGSEENYSELGPFSVHFLGADGDPDSPEEKTTVELSYDGDRLHPQPRTWGDLRHACQRVGEPLKGKANGLVAAAPELLAACRYALRFLEEYDVNNELHPSLKSKLKAAIAKAGSSEVGG